MLDHKINEENTRTIYFSYRIRPPESPVTLNGWNIPFVNTVKYLGVIFDKKIAWRMQIQSVAIKVFRTLITLHSLFKSERLNTNTKFNLYKFPVVISDKKITWKMHIQPVAIKVFRTFITLYSLFKVSN
jgi:hypothetical protein